jgi:hypothetical protein
MTGHLANLNSPLIEMSEASYIQHLYFSWFHLSSVQCIFHICTSSNLHYLYFSTSVQPSYAPVSIFVCASLHGTSHVLRRHIIFSCYCIFTTSVYMYDRDRHL